MLLRRLFSRVRCLVFRVRCSVSGAYRQCPCWLSSRIIYLTHAGYNWYRWLLWYSATTYPVHGMGDLFSTLTNKKQKTPIQELRKGRKGRRMGQLKLSKGNTGCNGSSSCCVNFWCLQNGRLAVLRPIRKSSGPIFLRCFNSAVFILRVIFRLKAVRNDGIILTGGGTNLNKQPSDRWLF